MSVVAERMGIPFAGRTVVFTGPFGSGKTEVAINYALQAARAGAACIVDLDVVTPYFRVGDLRDQLQSTGLRVVAPEGTLASFELPALPDEITHVLRDSCLHVVLDAGGDAEGARLLGVYADLIRGRGFEFLVVINPFRPSTNSPAEIVEQARAIEAQSRLTLTGVVANPNLGGQTRAEDVRLGADLVEQAAEKMGLPMALLAVVRHLAESQPARRSAILSLELLLRLPWEQEEWQESGGA